MNTQFAIKNFRVFGTQGSQFELAPITLLTGCNSAGKSSLVKALMLLTDTLKRVESKMKLNKECYANDFCLDFSSARNNSMGRFDKVLNRCAERTDAITFAYTIHSKFLADELIVELSFVAQPTDELNRGWLSAITFKKSSGEVILSAKVDDGNQFTIDAMSLTSIKPNFLKWGTYSCGLSTQDSLYTAEVLGEDYGVGKAELTARLEQIVSALKTLQIPEEDKRGYQELMDMNFSIEGYNPSLLWNSLVADSNTILYLPLVAKLSGMPKSEAIAYFTELNHTSESTLVIKSFAEKIIAEFAESNFETFSDYYLAKEEGEGLLFDNGRQAAFYEGDGLLQSIKSQTRIRTNGHSLGDNASFSFEELSEAKCYINKKMSTSDVEARTQELTFQDFYGTMVKLSLMDDSDTLKGLLESEWLGVDSDEDYLWSNDSHKLMHLFGSYLQSVVLEALSPKQLMNNRYVGSNRINVQRLYTFDDRNSDFTQLLQRYFEAKRNNTKEYEPNSFVNGWLNRFGIGKSVEIKLTDEGFGATIYLTKPNGERVLLADEGYGISQLVSVLLEVETAILESKTYMQRCEGATAPFALLRSLEGGTTLCYPPSTIAIEEPEVHLHPRYQSVLAEMFLEAYKLYNIHFIIETHSEYLIRKLQTLVARKEVQPSNVALHYIDQVEQAPSPNVRHIAIEADGRLNSPLGSGFFDEADNLAMNLLEIKAGM